MDGISNLIERLAGNPDYIKFLLVERPYIRSAMLSRSPLIDSEDRVSSYSVSLGNALHNDLIELDLWLDTLSPQDRALLADWAEREEGKQVYGVAKMRRVGKLLKKYGDQRGATSAS